MATIYVVDADVWWSSDADTPGLFDVSDIVILPPSVQPAGQLAAAGRAFNFDLNDVDQVRAAARTALYPWLDYVMGLLIRRRYRQYLSELGVAANY